MDYLAIALNLAIFLGGGGGGGADDPPDPALATGLDIQSGIQKMEVDPAEADESTAMVVVDRVDADTPASNAGLQVGDLIKQFGSVTKANFKVHRGSGSPQRREKCSCYNFKKQTRTTIQSYTKEMEWERFIRVQHCAHQIAHTFGV